MIPSSGKKRFFFLSNVLVGSGTDPTCYSKCMKEFFPSGKRNETKI
jgi:hypothetical protein